MMKTFYVGVKAIIVDKQRGALLLWCNRGEGYWDIPGGRIDDNEALPDTLKRELNEELPGSKLVKMGKPLGAERIHKDIDGDISLVLLYYEVDAELPDPLVLSDDHSSYKWINTHADIPEDVSTELAKILRDVVEK